MTSEQHAASVASDTRSVVRAYFDAWTTGRVSDAYRLLADDLVFAGPTGSFQTAAQFLPALERFAAITTPGSARIVDVLVEGDRAALLYDCELADPVGKIRISSFFRVAEGKIVRYETWFDATNLRRLFAQPKA